MNDLRSLTELRTTPLWKHIIVNNPGEIPADHGLVPDPLDGTPHWLWRWPAWRKFDYTYGFEPASPSEYDQPEYEITKQTYDRLLPALRLATVLLGKARPFLVRLTSCPPDPGGIIPASWVPTQLDYAVLDFELLFGLAQTYRILRAHDSTQVCYGITGHRERKHRTYVSSVSADLLSEVENDTWLDKNDMQKAAMLLLIAVTLVHELAHALFRRRLKDYPGFGQPMFDLWMTTSEVSIEPEKRRELGWSLERFLFNCSFHYSEELLLPIESEHPGSTSSVRQFIDCSKGLLAGIDASPVQDGSDEVWYHLAIQTIMSFYSKREWQQPPKSLYLFPGENADLDPLPWPYDGATIPATDPPLFK